MSDTLRNRLIAGSLMLCLCCSASAIAQPSNDSCATPVNLPCNSSVTVNNSTATQNAADPGFSCHFDGPGTKAFGTIWFTFTATHTSARVGTCSSTGTADDTELAVYDGTCGTLVELACGEDECGASGLLSRVCVEGLTIGNTYYIQVGSYRAADTGPVTVTLDCPCPAPPVLPETCQTATALTLPTGLIEINNDIAAPSNTPPFGSCNTGTATAVQNDIWYTVTTGASDCVLTLTLNTSYDALAIVYTGSDCNSLSEQACFDADINATHFFNATANTTYWIRIGDWGSFEGGGDTAFSLSCPTNLPTGACCSNLDGGCFETDQPDCEQSDGNYQGDGTTCAAGPCISACCLPNSTCTNVNGLATGFPDTDCSALGGTWLGPNTTCETDACPPQNDDCDAAVALTIPASVSFDNSGALPSSNGGGGTCNTTGATEMQNDVWYTVTTGDSDCDLSFEFESLNFYDMIVTIYTGTDCNNLTELVCGDEPQDPALVLSVPTTPNTMYWIRVGDWGSFEGGGPTRMNITCTFACNSCPGDANSDSTINGADIQTFTNCYVASGAGAECGCSDIDRDGDVDDDDTLTFVDLLLNETGVCDYLCDIGTNGQLPGLDNAFLSNGVDFEGADNFRAATNDTITHVRWWGVYDSDLCPDSDDSFVITYYNDNNGRPGAIKAGPFNVNASRETTGRRLLGIADEFLYEAAHAPVTVAANECLWLSIVNADSAGGCVWFWSISTDGDGFLASSNVPGTWPASSRQEGDQAFCLDIELNPTPCEPTGSCCLPGEICNNTTLPACAGVWTYDGNCATTACVDVPTDDCAAAPLLDCNATVTFDNSNATTAIDDPLFSCHFTAPEQGVGTMWYRFQATDTSARLRTCDSAVGDTLIAVYEGACGTLTELGCNEDSCGASGLLSELCVEGLTIGNVYYIQVASFDDLSQGFITLSLECPCPSVANDECIEAITVTCPSTTIFDNTNATPGPNDAPSPNDPAPSCSFDSNPAQATVWYTFIGNGQTWTVQSCNTANIEASNADTTLSIWTGGCGALAEVVCSEDTCFGGDVEQQGGVPEQWMSSVTFATVNGEQYWIMWSNAFADRGEIQMDITCTP